MYHPKTRAIPDLITALFIPEHAYLSIEHAYLSIEHAYISIEHAYLSINSADRGEDFHVLAGLDVVSIALVEGSYRIGDELGRL